MTIPGPRPGGGTWIENRTIYVDFINGLDTNAGTCPALAVKTFAQGYALISALAPSSASRARLALMPGTWTLPGAFTWALQGVVIEGVGGRDETIIEYNGASLMEITATDVELKNLHLRTPGGTTGNAVWIRSAVSVLFDNCRLSSYDTGSGVLINHASAVVIFNRCVIEQLSATVTSPCMTLTSCSRVETHDCEFNARILGGAGDYTDFNSKFTLAAKYGYYISSTLVVTLIGTKIVSTGGLACVYAGGTGLVSVLGCFLDNGGVATPEIVGASTANPVRCEGTVMKNGMGEYTRQLSNIHRTGAGQYGIDQHVNLDIAAERFNGYEITVMLDGDMDITTDYPLFSNGSNVVIDGRGRWMLTTANEANARIYAREGCTLTLQNLETYKCQVTAYVDSVLTIRRCVMRSQLNVNADCTAACGIYIEDSTFFSPNGYSCIAIDNVSAMLTLSNSNFYYNPLGALSAITFVKDDPNIEISGCIVTGKPDDQAEIYPFSNPTAPMSITSHRNSYTVNPFAQLNLANNVGTPYDVSDAYVGTLPRVR